MHTWVQAVDQFLFETQHKATHHEDKSKFHWLQPHLGDTLLRDITRDQISVIAELKLSQSSPATVNRYLSLIRAVLRRAAFDWEWTTKVPRIRFYKEPRRRVRWLTPDQVHQLLAELNPHQRDLVLFALATGLRHGNVVRLEWTQVDISKSISWIHPDQAKSRRALSVPLNKIALDVVRRQIGLHPVFVFSYKGKPIKSANTKAWTAALKRSGIENFRWHDLRHTWASWMVQQGVSLAVLQEMGGWETVSMVKRYAHLAPSHLLEHAEKIVHNFDP